MRSALTLIETVVALVLLATMTIVVTSWTTSTQALARATATNANWRAAAHATLQRISDDLVSRSPAPGSRRRVVEVAERELRIETRDGGGGVATYNWELDAGLLTRSFGRGSESAANRPLVGELADVRVTLDDEDDDDGVGGQVLTVTIVGEGDGVVARSWCLTTTAPEREGRR